MVSGFVAVCWTTKEDTLYWHVMVGYEVFAALMGIVVIATYYSKNRQMLRNRQLEQPHDVVLLPKREPRAPV